MKRKSTKLLWGILAFCFALLLVVLLWLRLNTSGTFKGSFGPVKMIEPQEAKDFRQIEISGAWEVKIVQREDF